MIELIPERRCFTLRYGLSAKCTQFLLKSEKSDCDKSKSMEVAVSIFT